jgi:hypothetical protein
MIYLLITISPLAPLAMQSRSVAHAVTGECSGDCDICGCSLERRTSHTCCCWQKKLKHDCARHEADESSAPCCKKKPGGKKVEITCNCPCGSGKHIALWGAEKIQHLPYRFTSGIPLSLENSIEPSTPDRLTSRHGEPPDPPPKLTLIS